MEKHGKVACFNCVNSIPSVISKIHDRNCKRLELMSSRNQLPAGSQGDASFSKIERLPVQTFEPFASACARRCILHIAAAIAMMAAGTSSGTGGYLSHRTQWH